MEEELYRLIPEEGKHLAKSHDNEEAVRGVYLDDETNKPCGAGEFVKVNLNRLVDDYSYETKDDNRDNDDVDRVIIVALIGIAVGVAAKTAYPHVKKWVADKAIPGVKKVWNGIFNKEKNVLTIETNEDNSRIECDQKANITIQRVIDNYKTKMTSEEAKKELIDAFLLFVLSVRKLRRVSQSQIINVDGEIVDGTEIIEVIINSGMVDEVNAIFDSNPELLEDKQCEILSEILGYQVVEKGINFQIDKLMLEKCLLNIS